MKITFTSLAESHFPLLLKWLEAPHVKKWWDQDIKWTPALIQNKYADYIKGYKLDNGVAKAISAYIMYADHTPIGYIQIYNAYDFSREEPLIGLPSRLAAFDVFIGDEAYLKQGVGSQSIAQFLKEHGTSYTHVFADAENTNIAAIRAYEKAGFKKTIQQPDTGEVWMIFDQTARPDPLVTLPHLSNTIIRQARLEDLRAIISLLYDDEMGQKRERLDEPLGQSYNEAFLAITRDPNHYLMVVEKEREIIASCHLTCLPSLSFQGSTRMIIENVHVASKYRNQKIGEHMMRAAIDYARSRGALIVQLTTHKNRTRAKKFYERLGFSDSHEGMKMYLNVPTQKCL